ncbi:MAG: DNA polymerase IV [bacterium]|nr:DNA polymerase IV [bacterium]
MAYESFRRILHCDMDCFYAAVHMRDEPALKGQPVVVGGSPEGRGVVAAANYEARRYGIHSAMPASQAKRLCPTTVFVRPDFSRYRTESEAIFSIYRKYTPQIQPLSLDEAFLDVTDHLGEYGSATAVAHEIRRVVSDEQRLTVSVGVGPNKLVAKIASDFDKPDGLTVVKPQEVEAFLAPLPIRRLPGIGPASEKRLNTMDIETVADLRALSLDRLLNRFGHWGRSLWERARGIDERPVRVDRVRKSLSTERTFETNIEGILNMDEILVRMAGEVAESLRRRELAGRTVTVKVRFSDFSTPTRSQTLDVPTASAATIAACARELLRRTDAQTRAVRLLGVGLSGLVPAALEQPDLFPEDGEERD